MIELDQAAKARRSKTRATADRPSQRRSGEHPDAPVRALTRCAPQLREKGDGSGLLEYSGYASVTGRGYDMWDFFGPYTEVVEPGSFASSLSRADLDVPLVLAHDSLRRIARTTTGTLLLEEDDHGLRNDAPALDPSDADVAYIAPKIRAGLIDEQSFRFRILAGEWSPDWTEYHITDVDIHRGDVAIVGYGANPYTSGQLRSVVEKVTAGRELLAGDVSALRQALEFAGQVDGLVDDMRGALDAYLAGHEAGDVVDLATETLDLLRGRETAIRSELERRGAPRRLSLLEVLAD